MVNKTSTEKPTNKNSAEKKKSNVRKNTLIKKSTEELTNEKSIDKIYK